MPNNGRTIVWQTIYGTAPSAINVVLESAMHDVDTQYAPTDTSTATAGESRTVTNVLANFVRAKVSSITGGSGVVVPISGSRAFTRKGKPCIAAGWGSIA
jgi:hypothetical protein